MSREKETRRLRKEQRREPGDGPGIVKTGRVLRRGPRRDRQLVGSSVLLERRGWAIVQRLINKHLLQDKETH